MRGRTRTGRIRAERRTRWSSWQKSYTCRRFCHSWRDQVERRFSAMITVLAFLGILSTAAFVGTIRALAPTATAGSPSARVEPRDAGGSGTHGSDHATSPSTPAPARSHPVISARSRDAGVSCAASAAQLHRAGRRRTGPRRSGRCAPFLRRPPARGAPGRRAIASAAANASASIPGAYSAPHRRPRGRSACR